MTTPASTSPAPSGLSPDQLLLLEKAKRDVRKIRRARFVALTDASIAAFFAASTLLLTALFPSACGIFISLGLTLVTVLSFVGAVRLKRLDLTAPRLLGYNQLLLMAVITIYALWSMYTATYHREHSELLRVFGGSDASDPLSKDLADIGRSFEAFYFWLPIIIYSAVIFGTLLGQGLAAFYYFRRRRIMREYLAATPEWILDLHRRGLL